MGERALSKSKVGSRLNELLGHEIDLSKWMLVDQDMIDGFSHATGDRRMFGRGDANGTGRLLPQFTQCSQLVFDLLEPRDYRL
jgi:hypothetical protein